MARGSDVQLVLDADSGESAAATLPGHSQLLAAWSGVLALALECESGPETPTSGGCSTPRGTRCQRLLTIPLPGTQRADWLAAAAFMYPVLPPAQVDWYNLEALLVLGAKLDMPALLARAGAHAAAGAPADHAAPFGRAASVTCRDVHADVLLARMARPTGPRAAACCRRRRVHFAPHVPSGRVAQRADKPVAMAGACGCRWADRSCGTAGRARSAARPGPLRRRGAPARPDCAHPLRDVRRACRRARRGGRPRRGPYPAWRPLYGQAGVPSVQLPRAGVPPGAGCARHKSSLSVFTGRLAALGGLPGLFRPSRDLLCVNVSA